MKSRFIYITLFICFSAAAQTVTVTGVVEDMNGAGPIIGATVMEKGTSNGTITDIDGRFSLEVRQGATVEVSYMGYLTKSFSAKRESSA